MANITRIKAKDPNKPSDDKKPKNKKVVEEAKPTVVEESKKTTKSKKAKSTKKPFVLFRPFIALGRYLKESWQEIRQVRWPNRKTTWQMVLAVFAYTALFIIIIMLLDAVFTVLFNLLLG